MRWKRFIWASTVILVLCSDVLATSPCYVVDENGTEQRIASWDRLVVREIEVPAGGQEEAGGLPTLYSPAPLAAFLYRGAVIPLEDVKYILPTLGVFVLKDGVMIEANPLRGCAFSKEHRVIDIEHQHHQAAAASLDSASSRDVLLFLEVFVEFTAMDTVAGYPITVSRAATIHDARIVAFDPDVYEAARNLWADRTSSTLPEPPLFPFAGRLGGRADIHETAGGEVTGRMGEGATVEVMELEGEWARVRVEGWMKRKNLEEKPR